MIPKLLLALGSLLATWVALKSDNHRLQFFAALTGASCLSFAATSLVLKRDKPNSQHPSRSHPHLDFLDPPDDSPLIPQPQRPKPCRGCLHYHGRSYGGNLLICAIYPYGVDSDHCDSWHDESSAETHHSDS
ncbi:MAG: hypothetical protein F6K19_47370 [Cyanothece sp. SIO1E1]|nr:hypothetical protein [Cyanothece sp. SIO1E1]